MYMILETIPGIMNLWVKYNIFHSTYVEQIYQLIA